MSKLRKKAPATAALAETAAAAPVAEPAPAAEAAAAAEPAAEAEAAPVKGLGIARGARPPGKRS